MKLYNSLTRKLENFKPINPPCVGMYACGPTVYDYATIGNWRTYVLADTLLRALKYLGYEVDYIMNITDVGHLTGDNLGDADVGEDRLAKAARKERKTAWEIAEFYTDRFINEFDKLNLLRPRLFTKATDHIREQIELVRRIERAGFTYIIDDGVYFDVGNYEKSNKYGELSTLDDIKRGARVEPNPQKKDPRDFALWKFSPEGRKRDMEWDSPWGKGFPGWHIECSAMSMKYLGEQFDIHVGGEDLRSIHHPNEVAQSEAATGGKPFVKYWVHGAFLLVDGGRMGKSLGNAHILQDLEKRGFDPLDLRYFYLMGHYRKQQNFTWNALRGAKKAREKLLAAMGRRADPGERAERSRSQRQGRAKTAQNSRLARAKFINGMREFQRAFERRINNDLNMPEALAVAWKVARSDLTSKQKHELLLDFDKVLGLKLEGGGGGKPGPAKLPKEVRRLVAEREELRSKNEWNKADKIRKQLLKKGYLVEDTAGGPRVRQKPDHVHSARWETTE